LPPSLLAAVVEPVILADVEDDAVDSIVGGATSVSMVVVAPAGDDGGVVTGIGVGATVVVATVVVVVVVRQVRTGQLQKKGFGAVQFCGTVDA